MTKRVNIIGSYFHEGIDKLCVHGLQNRIR